MREVIFLKRSILAIGIISLFIVSALIPMSIGYNVKTSNETESQSTSSGGLMNSSWPMFGHDARHTGRSPYGKSGTWYIEKWIKGISSWCSSSPVIDKNGTIYIGGGWYLYAINSNGTLKWKYKTGGTVSNAPAIAEDGTIYLPSDDAKVYALNPDGIKKWSITIGDGSVSSSPAIDEDGTIYATSWLGENVRAIYPNGTTKWNFKTGGLVFSSPAIYNDAVYLGSYDSYLYAIYKNNGTLKWKYNSPYQIAGLSIGDDGTIYFGNQLDWFYAINPNGTMKWRKNIGDWIYFSPAIDEDGTIYVVADNGEISNIFSINPNGTINWKYSYYKTDPYLEITVTSPAIDKYGIIYFGTRDGWLLALNPDGTLRWSYKGMEGIESSTAIGEDGTIYFSSFTPMAHGNLYALEPVEGNSPPEIPVIYGRKPRLYFIKYAYTATSIDPDGDNISYLFDWGDRTNSGWTEFVPSGTPITRSHRWIPLNVHILMVTIRVKAKDEHGAWSDWGRLNLNTNYLKDKSMSSTLFLRFLERYPLLERFLTLLIN